MRRLAWVCCAVLAGLLLAGGHALGLQDPAPIPGWGDPVDPARDCAIAADGAALTIEVPGKSHDLSPDRSRRAPRVLRDIEGNFQVDVKVTAALDPGTEPAGPGMKPAQGAGLVLWQDDNNFIRLDRSAVTGADGTTTYHVPLLLYCKDGGVAHATPGAATPRFEGPDTWLRLTRRGSRLTVFVSPDGQAWTEVESIDVRLPSRMRIGVFAMNTSNRPFQARFEGFQRKGISLSG